MILIDGLEYDVCIITRRNRTRKARSYSPSAVHDYMVIRLRYCGGSCVDHDGHHVGGGVWCKGEHPNTQYFRDLPIANISEVPGVDYSWAHKAARSGELSRS